ncbi:hypothetical protein BIV57_17910 [Mangrovactinospora gilvigrisea]|uniref:Major facilitator superfamily (MFS) profile domain-containing protein n=1 Tax=Mangrovactinospora gilvigrisea TaxID=1428644 RepID=A0A1J7BRP0_9ACTN|nr:hypothetical protein BIV57_17910 [Mangrovactinospora gilvigrisea]
MGLAALMFAGSSTTLLEFALNLGIPGIEASTGATAAMITVAILGYNLASGAPRILTAKLGDRIGQKAVFRYGLILFIIACAVCALAPSALVLIIGRVTLGFSAALMCPQVFALMRLVYAPGPHLTRSVALYSAISGSAGLAGQLLTGALITFTPPAVGWRLAFTLNAVAGIAALWFVRALPDVRTPHVQSGRLDVLGSLLVSAGLVGITLPLALGSDDGWPLWTWAMIGAGVALIALFAAHQRYRAARGRVPLLDLRVFAHSPGLVPALGSVAVYFVILSGSALGYALYLEARGWSALEVASVFGVLNIGFLCPPLVEKPFRKRFPSVSVAVPGGLLMIAGFGMVGAVALAWSVPLFMAGLVVAGLGMGLSMAAVWDDATAAVPERHAGTGSGLTNTIQENGSALGVAVAGIAYFGARTAALGLVWVSVLLIAAAVAQTGLSWLYGRRMAARERS